MRRLVIGDIHGAHKALRDVLDRAEFDPQNDQLFCLGDYVDGWPESYEVVEYLSRLPDHHVFIFGNHDEWALKWMMTGRRPMVWTSQGGQATLDSYKLHGGSAPRHHIRFINSGKLWHHTDDNKLFVHGDVDVSASLVGQPATSFLWGRHLCSMAVAAWKFPKEHTEELSGPYDEVYLGHTSIWSHSREPIYGSGVWCMDTGAGWHGKLSLVDIDTKELWQSDLTKEYYPDAAGRR